MGLIDIGIDIGALVQNFVEQVLGLMASTVASIFDLFSNTFLDVLGVDLSLFDAYFPFLQSCLTVFQYVAHAILFLIVVFQLFRSFGGKITDAENPLILIVRWFIFTICITYSKEICDIALDFAAYPYYALQDWSYANTDLNYPLNNIMDIFQSVLGSYIQGMALSLIVVICVVLIGWNYLKLLLECCERYILLAVLCYTSPLAFSLGASQTTKNCFAAWCKMLGSQFVVLWLNVWFVRGFNFAIATLVETYGSTTVVVGDNGEVHQVSIFIWFFCVLAFLKIAQKIDSHLYSIGLNTGRTGGQLGVELLAATRSLAGGFGGGGKTAGNVFGGGTAKSPIFGGGGFVHNIANRFRPNSYVRDAVIQGGQRMGANGITGAIGRFAGGLSAKYGGTLDVQSISSVANNTALASGVIGGSIAAKSVGGYIPSLSGMTLGDTTISGGHISTIATTSDGKTANVDLYNAAIFDKPKGTPYSVVQGNDGSLWYQVATGEGAESMFKTPQFNGEKGDAVQEFFPSADNNLQLQTTDNGIIEATSNDGTTSQWYNSGIFEEPEAPHTTIQDSNGVDWYCTQPNATMPDLESFATPQYDAVSGDEIKETFRDASPDKVYNTIGDGAIEELNENNDVNSHWYSSNYFERPQSPHTTAVDSNGVDWYCVDGNVKTVPEAKADPVISEFTEFIPSQQADNISSVKSDKDSGIIEVANKDGTGTRFYDASRYEAPRGEYTTVTDRNNHSWYSVNGNPVVETKPVYVDGKPAYDQKGNVVTTKTPVVKYGSKPKSYQAPSKRSHTTVQAPQRKSAVYTVDKKSRK